MSICGSIPSLAVSQSRRNRPMKTIILFVSMIASLGGADEPTLDSNHPWQIDGAAGRITWVEIHSFETFNGVDIVHVELMSRKKTAKPWEFGVLAPHLAVSTEVLKKSVLRPLRIGSVYPETYEDGYRYWKRGLAQGKVVICTKPIANLAKALDSPAYKLWRTAFEVQNGVQMISKAHQVLNDDAASNQSGTTDLAARARAREELADDKDFIKREFRTYKKLGGKAATPRG